jgi:NAD(P)-dependent dehydrogenase (short-subunit alcohol dehydrogenase family)
MKLQNKVAIVTGAATGIGKAIATTMAAEGASVVIDYVGDPAFANAAVQAIQAAGGKVTSVAADVSNPSQVNQLIQKAIDSFGKLDILVNNAGLEYKHPFHEFPFDLWQKVIAVDLTGPFLCAQAAHERPVLRRKRWPAHVDAHHRRRTRAPQNHRE